MKLIVLITGLATFLSFQNPALADAPCHALRFDSYFVAQNLKDNLKTLNPNVAQANFDGQFLLLRAELAMETVYLIAACDTGNFFHEKLGVDNAGFSLKSNRVETHNKDGSTGVYEWDGKSWVKGEVHEAPVVSRPVKDENNPKPQVSGASSVSSNRVNPSVPGLSDHPVSGTSEKQSMVDAYQALFAKYTVPVRGDTCAPLDYGSYFRAQENKKLIPEINKDLQHANYAGTKQLVKIETMFDTVYLLADCKTGKFTGDFLKGNLTFKSDSQLAILNSVSNHPELYLWSGSQWFRIPDPVQTQKDKLSNTLYGDKAQQLIAVLPNPERRDILRFENLKASPPVEGLFQDLGVDMLRSGTCHIAHGKAPTCEVETQ